MLDAAEEPLEHRRQLLLDVGDPDEFLVELVAAVLAIPLKAVALTGAARALDDEAHGIRGPPRRMRHVRRQQEDLTLVDGDVDAFAVLHRGQRDATLELVE